MILKYKFVSFACCIVQFLIALFVVMVISVLVYFYSVFYHIVCYIISSVHRFAVKLCILCACFLRNVHILVISIMVIMLVFYSVSFIVIIIILLLLSLSLLLSELNGHSFSKYRNQCHLLTKPSSVS